MFVYISPRTGNSAMVESVTKGAKRTGGYEVRWTGGGIWACHEHNLTGNLLNYDDLEKITDTEFDAGLSRILESTESESPITEGITVDEDEP